MHTPMSLADSPCPDPTAPIVQQQTKSGLVTPSEPVVSPQWTVESALRSFGVSTPSKPPITPVAFFHLLERLKTTPREGWRRFGVPRPESISDHMYRMAIITFLAPAITSATLAGGSQEPSRPLDAAHCMQLALVHDMAESIVGDITPADGVKKEEKSRRESTTMAWLTEALLGVPPSASALDPSLNATKAASSAENRGVSASHRLTSETPSLPTPPSSNTPINPSSSAPKDTTPNFSAAMASAGSTMQSLWREYEDGETPEAIFVKDVDKLELILQMVEYERRLEGALDMGEFVRVGTRIRLPEVRAWCAELLREREIFWSERANPADSAAPNGMHRSGNTGPGEEIIGLDLGRDIMAQAREDAKHAA